MDHSSECIGSTQVMRAPQLGTAFGGVKGRSELPVTVEEAMRGDINTAFDLMHDGKSIRSVVKY